MSRRIASLGLVLSGLFLLAPMSCRAALPAEDLSGDQVDLEKKIRTLQAELDALRAQRVASAGDLAGEKSVKPGINKSWKSDEVEPLVERLESESREIFTGQAELAALVGPVKGMAVADVGAGSGFMAERFAGLVGDTGHVYAVDINATMMERVAQTAQDKGIANLSTVVCGEKSVDLEKNSVDLVFICDTYHHFEYPRNSLRSIHEALRPGGQIVMVEFKRIPGESREWIFGHVRAGEEVFTREVEAAGFELINTHYPPFLKENYVLRFRKAGASPAATR